MHPKPYSLRAVAALFGGFVGLARGEAEAEGKFWPIRMGCRRWALKPDENSLIKRVPTSPLRMRL
jgi:hypothetical protein